MLNTCSIHEVHAPPKSIRCTMSGRWADSAEDLAREAALKKEKELKKRLKKERDAAAARKAAEEAAQRRAREAEVDEDDENSARPSKRRKVTPEAADADTGSARLLRFQGGGFGKSRSVENYDKLNDIEEGAYGWVARAKEIATGKVVALKRLKIEPNDRNGLPVTGLREIQILKDCEHRNIVKLQEVVVGEDTSRIEKCVASLFILSMYLSSGSEKLTFGSFPQHLPRSRLSRTRSQIHTRRHAATFSCKRGQNAPLPTCLGRCLPPR